MNGKYAFIVAASMNYLPGLIAFLNSLEYHKVNAEIILISYQLPDDFINELKSYPFDFHISHMSPEKSQSHDTAFGRFKIAYERGHDYSSICLIDADMFVTGDITLFFEIASKGFIVTGSNGMVINFNKDYQKYYQVNLGVDEFIYPKVHTTCPIFLNSEHLDWFEKWYNLPRIDHFDDFLLLNMIGIFLKKYDKMICMPPYTFTGIHHWQMKVETGVIKKSNFLLSGTEEQVYMVHGKFWDPGWLQDLWPTMQRYLKDNNFGPKAYGRVKNCISLLRKEFNFYMNLKEHIPQQYRSI
jgi:hypothetical protein